MQRYTAATVIAGMLAMACVTAWSNPEDHTHHHAVPAPSVLSVVDLDVPDLELVDQDGRPTLFRSDLIGDRLAAVTFTYTSCSTVCPILDRVFQGVQEMLPDDDAGETVLITVSIDPVNDVPMRLKAHAEKVGAKPGWRFLTGNKATVTRLLRALEVYSADIFNHPPAVYVVDGDRDVWTRLNGFPSSDMIAQVFDSYRAARDPD